MSKQTEALRLAKELVSVHRGHADEGPSTFSEAASELRRLHLANAYLLEALKNCMEWMEDLRTSGDAGNWEWKNDQYTQAMTVIAKVTGEKNGD
jgi:hypothetical protein